MDNTTNIFSNLKSEPTLLIPFFVGIWILSTLGGTCLVRVLLDFYNYSDALSLIDVVKEDDASKDALQLLKLISAISNGFAYLVPSCIFVLLVYNRQATSFLFVDKLPNLKNVVLSVGLILTSYGIISFIYYYNTILIPQEYINSEVLGLEQLMLRMDDIFDLLFNLFIFSCIAGIGEELFFRGILQRYMIEWTKNMWMGVLLTGLLFTLMHFQLEGLVPRFLLSVLLSLCVVLTGNLWISILMHMFFNSLPFFVNYFSSSNVVSVDKVTEVPLTYALLSLLCTILLWITFRKVNRNTKYIKI